MFYLLPIRVAGRNINKAECWSMCVGFLVRRVDLGKRINFAGKVEDLVVPFTRLCPIADDAVGFILHGIPKSHMAAEPCSSNHKNCRRWKCLKLMVAYALVLKPKKKS